MTASQKNPGNATLANDTQSECQPVAWCDDAVIAGKVGNCASSAAKKYWQSTGNFADKITAERLTNPLYHRQQAAAAPESCHWHQEDDDGAWHSDCNRFWIINEGPPSDNGMKFCHGCGKPLVEHPFEWPTDDDDAPEPTK